MMTKEEIRNFIELIESKTPEDWRECIPTSELNYFGTQQVLFDYCDKYGLVEGDSYLYVLRCAEDMFYIGETAQIFHRLVDHFSPSGKSGSSTTQIYEPLCVHEVVFLDDADKSERLHYEDALTIEYINKYNIYQVRGGHFANYDRKKAYEKGKLKQYGLREENGKLVFINPLYSRIAGCLGRLRRKKRIHPVL